MNGVAEGRDGIRTRRLGCIDGNNAPLSAHYDWNFIEQNVRLEWVKQKKFYKTYHTLADKLRLKDA